MGIARERYAMILVNLPSMVFAMMVLKLIITTTMNITAIILMMIWVDTTLHLVTAVKLTMHMHMMTIIWLMMDIVYQHVLRVLIVLIVEVLMPSLTTLSLLPLTVVLRLLSTHVHMPEMASVMTLVEPTTVS